MQFEDECESAFSYRQFSNTDPSLWKRDVFGICFGLAAWGQAAKTHLNKILLLQKRALRIINFSDRRDHAIPLFIDANVLPLNFLYYQTISNLMHDVHNNMVPSGILNLFQTTSSCHYYNTRASASGNFYVKSGCQRKPGKMLKMSTEGGQ